MLRAPKILAAAKLRNPYSPGVSSIAVVVLRTPKKTDMLWALRSVLRAELRRSPGISKWVSRDVFLRYFDGFWRGVFGHVIKNTHKMGQNTRKYCHVTSNKGHVTSDKGHVMLISDPSNSAGLRRSSVLTPYSEIF